MGAPYYAKAYFEHVTYDDSAGDIVRQTPESLVPLRTQSQSIMEGWNGCFGNTPSPLSSPDVEDGQCTGGGVRLVQRVDGSYFPFAPSPPLLSLGTGRRPRKSGQMMVVSASAVAMSHSFNAKFNAGAVRNSFFLLLRRRWLQFKLKYIHHHQGDVFTLLNAKSPATSFSSTLASPVRYKTLARSPIVQVVRGQSNSFVKLMLALDLKLHATVSFNDTHTFGKQTHAASNPGLPGLSSQAPSLRCGNSGCRGGGGT